MTADTAPSADLTVKLTVSEAAGTAFVAAGDEGEKTVTITGGSASATYSVDTVADTTDEPHGSVTVQVAAGPGYAVGTTASASVTVSDDEAGTLIQQRRAAGRVRPGQLHRQRPGVLHRQQRPGLQADPRGDQDHHGESQPANLHRRDLVGHVGRATGRQAGHVDEPDRAGQRRQPVHGIRRRRRSGREHDVLPGLRHQHGRHGQCPVLRRDAVGRRGCGGRDGLEHCERRAVQTEPGQQLELPAYDTAKAASKLVSNVDQTSSGTSGLDVNDQVQGFGTGAHALGYTLDSADVTLGTPSGVSVKLLTGVSASNAGTEVATLTNPASLDAGINTFTAPAGTELSASTTYLSGRKSDVLDCQWIRQLMSHGLLRGAFRAPDAICPLRAYLRQRDELVRQRSHAVHHVQKALAQMS